GYSKLNIFDAAKTLTITICASIFHRGVMSLIPVLIGIVGGYMSAMLVAIEDFTGIIETACYDTPDLHLPFVSNEATWNV
ncbi:uracil permease, partial [Salinicoccus roseus]